MPVVSGDVIRYTAKMSLVGNDVQNVYHFQASGTGSAPNEDVLTNGAVEINALHGLINDWISQGLEYDTINGFNVTQDELLGEINWPTLIDGDEATSETYASQVAAVVRFPTAVARSQGRKFIGGLTEAGIVGGGELVPGLVTDLTSYASNALSGFSALGLTFDPGAWNPTLVRFAPFTAALVNLLAGTQRRRKFGIGS